MILIYLKKKGPIQFQEYKQEEFKEELSSFEYFILI